MFRFACNGEIDIMAYRVFLDSFSGEITDLKRGQRTQENMLAVLAQHPLVSTWDMSEHAWVRNEIANMVKDELIVSVEQPYPWLRYELTDKGRALMMPNDKGNRLRGHRAMIKKPDVSPRPLDCLVKFFLRSACLSDKLN